MKTTLQVGLAEGGASRGWGQQRVDQQVVGTAGGGLQGSDVGRLKGADIGARAR
jgi:hypothetical protein